MKLHTRFAGGLTVLGGLMLAGSAWAGCPPPYIAPAATVNNSVSFGDALVYSLPLLAQTGGVSVQSSPGQISDCLVVMTGAGAAMDNGLPTSADNAYDDTGGQKSGYFRTGDATLPNNVDPPGGAFVAQFLGDTANTWDVKLSALKTYLNGGAMTFMFNHNQQGSGSSGGTGAINEDLFIWAQVKILNVVSGAFTNYYLTATQGPTGLLNFGSLGNTTGAYSGPQNDVNKNTYPSITDLNGFPKGGACAGDAAQAAALTLPLCGAVAAGQSAQYMVHARGKVCLNALEQPVPCGSATATHFINDNLGANEVANAAIFPEINAFLATLSDADAANYVMQIDLRMGCNWDLITTAPGPTTTANSHPTCPDGSILENGYEQLFIVGGPPNFNVPEPATVGLLGAALVGLFAAGRRRKQ